MALSVATANRLTVPKVSDVLAEQLRETILRGEWADGSPLPTERALGERSGLSRASVREALRILESEGLIETRRGRNGGASIKQPTADVIARSVGLYVRGQRIRLIALLETREALEPAVARLAALNRTAEDIADLVEAQARLTNSMTDRRAYLQGNIDWHMAVARASHNEPLIGFMTAICEVIRFLASNPGVEAGEVSERARMVVAAGI
jgi:DNA-binding FadR family transcriptional regulator